jgi:hypothetical protein
VTIVVRCLHICRFQPLLCFKNVYNFELLHLASELPLIPKGERTPMDENLFVKVADDTEVSHGLAEEDKDFLDGLEKMAEELEDEADKPK